MKRLARIIIQYFIILVIVLYCGSMSHATIINSAYSYDSITGLYTYTYEIDNTLGPYNILEFTIFIDIPIVPFQLYPESFTAPTPWVFAPWNSSNVTYTGWTWAQNHNGLLIGQAVSGFSFTTQAGPNLTADNNYFLFGYQSGSAPNFRDLGVFRGTVVAPSFMNIPITELRIIPAPEPTSFFFLTAGLAVLIIWRTMFT